MLFRILQMALVLSAVIQARPSHALEQQSGSSPMSDLLQKCSEGHMRSCERAERLAKDVESKKKLADTLEAVPEVTKMWNCMKGKDVAACEWLRANFLHGIHAPEETVKWLDFECRLYKTNCDLLAKTREELQKSQSQKVQCPKHPPKTPSERQSCYDLLVASRYSLARVDIIQALREDCDAMDRFGVGLDSALPCNLAENGANAACKSTNDCVQVVEQCATAPANRSRVDQVRANLQASLMRIRCARDAKKVPVSCVNHLCVFK